MEKEEERERDRREEEEEKSKKIINRTFCRWATNYEKFSASLVTEQQDSERSQRQHRVVTGSKATECLFNTFLVVDEAVDAYLGCLSPNGLIGRRAVGRESVGEDEVRLLRNLSAEGEEKLRLKGWEISKWAVAPLSWAALPASQIISSIAVSGKFTLTNTPPPTRCCIFARCESPWSAPSTPASPFNSLAEWCRRPYSASPRSLFPAKDGRHGPSLSPNMAPNTPYSPLLQSYPFLPSLSSTARYLHRTSLCFSSTSKYSSPHTFVIPLFPESRPLWAISPPCYCLSNQKICTR